MKKIDEMKQKLAGVKDEVRSLLDANKVEEAEVKAEEVRNLNKAIKIQSELDAQDIEEVEVKMTEKRTDKQEVKVEARSAFFKALKGKEALNKEERALVQESIGTDGGYLVPKEIHTDINEAKRQYKSAKDVVGVINVTSEQGSFVIEDGRPTPLLAFDEDNEGLEEVQPKFKDMAYKVLNYGAITPISRSFLQDEDANFMAYLNSFFARKAIATENARIFAELKRGKTAVAVTNVKSMKKLVNVSIDPAFRASSVIVTNQSGFNALDSLEDLDGRGILSADAQNATMYRMLGLEIHVFSDEELPNVAGKAPIFAGSLKEGVKFFDRGVYEVALSTESRFDRNQHVARVVERFDVKQADATAYVYGEIALAE